MSSLTAVVTSLGQLVGSLATVLGDVAVLSARVTLDGASLAVLGKVVWSTTLVAHGALGSELSTLSGSWSTWRSSSRFVLRTVSRDVAEFGTAVTLGALGRVWAVALDVANISTQVTLLGSSGLWLRASGRFVTCLATVVTQSFLLLAVVGNVAGFTAFVTRSGEHFVVGEKKMSGKIFPGFGVGRKITQNRDG